MKLKICLDALMLAVLLLLMPYSLIGEELHEILGVAMFVLFAVHQFLNRSWYKSLKSAKFNLRTAINLMLPILMILQVASGILMAKHLVFVEYYDFASTARLMHLAISYWLLIFVAIHLGLHFKLLKSQLKINHVLPLKILAGTISIYGFYVFINRKILDYMFLKSEFVFLDFSENAALVVADYFAIMILFSIIGCKLKN